MMKKNLIRTLALGLVLCMALGMTVCAAGFTDLDSGAWYFDSVSYCVENGLMNGKPGNKFDPAGTLTRAELVTILYRYEGEPAFMNDNVFDDVVPGSWYEKAVVWANGKAIVGGYGNGKFGPTDPVKREQIAVILYRYAQFKEMDVTVDENTNFLSFNDFWDVSDYAKPAMMWALERGIITGSGWDLNPGDTATRAQAAAMLERFCKLGEPAVGPVAGGWTVNADLEEAEMPPLETEVFVKAMAGLTGVKYTPVAYLGSQVVAGTNYAFLCKTETVTAEPVTKLAVVTIYRDLTGEPTVTEIMDVDLAASTEEDEITYEPELAGGWKINAEAGKLEAGAKAAFDEAAKGLLGVKYAPLACIGKQVVAGTNYAILCAATKVTAEPASALVVMVVNDPISGDAATILRIGSLVAD